MLYFLADCFCYSLLSARYWICFYIVSDSLVLLMIRRPPRSTRTDTSPYTTLFRSPSLSNGFILPFLDPCRIREGILCMADHRGLEPRYPVLETGASPLNAYDP